jgi:uncharacterized OsmC-like protein
MVPEDIQTVTLSHVGNYQFLIDFGMIAPLQSDEPHPIGQGQGPSPEQLLAASIANCLCASLFFALTKYRQPADGLKADVAISTLRNERGRLRIRAVNVDIVLPMESQKEEQISRYSGKCKHLGRRGDVAVCAGGNVCTRACGKPGGSCASLRGSRQRR